jgi:DNA-binding CsgD family transcriptional regulator
MLQCGYASVLQAQDRDELRSEMVGFAQNLGFRTISATMVVEHLMGDPELITLGNTPTDFNDAYNNRENWKRDPVMQYCRHHSVPIIWNQSTYLEVGQGDVWEEQAHFGYHSGIALALHLPQGEHFLIGVDRDASLPGNTNELTRMVADLQLFAVHAQAAASRLLLPSAASQAQVPSLTARELEGLRWTMEGKTAWEVGNILGISERTAVLHVNNAMHKLGCVNKHQAVLKALRMGLLR